MHNEPTALPITITIIKTNALSVNSRAANIKHKSAIECSAPHSINVGTPIKTMYQFLVVRYVATQI